MGLLVFWITTKKAFTTPNSHNFFSFLVVVVVVCLFFCLFVFNLKSMESLTPVDCDPFSSLAPAADLYVFLHLLLLLFVICFVVAVF